MRRQPIELQTLYAELLERVAAYEASRAIGHVPGSFVTKTIKGHDYYYFQYSEPGDRKRQVYVGRRTPSLDAVVVRHGEERSLVADDVADIERICALLRAGGAMVTDTGSARVVRALSDTGVFQLGGVLVGTHAFLVLGNVLGVVWTNAGMRTQDVDVAADTSVSVAVTGSSADIPGTLDSLEMGFLPVPSLDRAGHSTSYKVRGQGLRVDLLAPARQTNQKEIRLPRLNAWAQPLKYLDYLVEDAISAVVVDGGATSANVPGPARFALHKLIVAQERPAAFHAKRDKDLLQASQILEVLVSDRPGDIQVAWEALADRGKGWVKRATAGLAAIERSAAETAEKTRQLVGV